MKRHLEQFIKTGKVVTHYFNGYGFTNKTKQVKLYFETHGLINGKDFKIVNFMGEKSRTKIVKL